VPISPAHVTALVLGERTQPARHGSDAHASGEERREDRVARHAEASRRQPCANHAILASTPLGSAAFIVLSIFCRSYDTVIVLAFWNFSQSYDSVVVLAFWNFSQSYDSVVVLAFWNFSQAMTPS